ncbi:ABC transporter ATP-binding protein [Crossiella cryophila]|uniref:ABC-2 type transport system ATP-binding protein n=1 Tax=Crossiella cryophila TaxID=43355 RepID=A0A7W7CC04_9PSEU|nr:ABC transporter ATP-binding protein [Crossiella cryophila]MBB4678371.1 ABC-2 type transport system ATP-binding protein [Crossiella cryophila]
MERAEPDAVSVRELRMCYGRTEVLRGVELTIRRGEIFCLLGPNGAGKTTMIEILEGHRRRSGGEVRVLGSDPGRPGPGWRARIGVVSQSWRDHAQWRVGELLSYVAGHYPDPHDPAELLTLVGLTAQRDHPVARLSGGQRRRLDVALGVIGRPELLFLDEPTAGLDPVARRQFHDLVTQLSGTEGMTILLTTHDLTEAERLAHRIGILVQGRLITTGTPAALATMTTAGTEVRWAEAGGQRRELVEDPSALLRELNERFGCAVPELQVRRQSLEDTYLDLIGR